jgi:5'-nucleotidase / UDP-sugar diphosphatase
MKKYIYLLFISIFALSCKGQQSKQQVPNEEIVILHVNDIHANIDNFPRFVFMVDSIKKIHKNVFLLNAGDIFTGSPYVDMYADKGFPVIDLMNDAGFNLSAFGNHEYDYGQEVLALRIKQAKFPFICSNMENIGGMLPNILPTYQFKTNSGLVINVFSIIENSANGLPESHPSKLKGLMFSKGLEIANQFKSLKKNANVLIALSHLGIESDDTLAMQMPELDMIIGGHSHTVLDSGKLVNGVLIVQAGARLKFLGETTLTFNNGKLIGKKDKLIYVNRAGNSDLKMKDKVDKYNKNPYFEEVIGQAAEEFANTEEIGCFITDAYREYGKSDIAFQNSGGIRISEIDKGPITRGLIFKLDPFGNKLSLMEMKLDEIKSLILYASKDGKIDLRVSGINYNIITENIKVRDVLITDNNGQALSADKSYKVAMNDYILNTYEFNHPNNVQNLDIITANILMEYLKNRPVKYSGVKRTFINGK